MKPDPVRRRALDVLVRVAGGAPLDALLDRTLNGLTEPRDRAFCAQLVRGTLQWQGRYDHLIGRFARRRPPTDPGVLAVLRMSLHQLLGQDGVPAYAALHQAGELCRHLRRGRPAAGFVNGLLQSVRRRILGDGTGPIRKNDLERRLRAEFADLEADRAAWVAAWHSHPRWLVERWVGRWGADEAEALCAHANRPVPVTLHVLEPADPHRTAEALDRGGFGAAPGPDPRSLVLNDRPARGDLARLVVQHPELIVQDATVQLATAWLLAAAPGDDAGAPGFAVDLCAAPGGKTAQLAARWPGPVVAMDYSRPRLDLLEDTCGRLARRPVGLVRGDALEPPLPVGRAQVILLDGPCSGTGVLRHHPDGRWRLTPETVKRCAARLGIMARRAADLLAPGGVLMYGTCSLEPQEDDEVVADLVAVRGDLELLPDAEGRGTRLWLPHQAGGDGFYAARLIKRSPVA